MATEPRHPIDDLRGLLGLAAHATVEITDTVEAVHQAVFDTLGFAPAGDGRTRGLTGLAYRGVRAAAGGIAAAGDRLLRALPRRHRQAPGGDPAQRAALLAALNGVFGDRLAAAGNPLALPMRLLHGETVLLPGAPVDHRHARPRLLLVAHGLCMNHLQWRARHRGQAVDHGQRLAEALDATPVHLHYNTGLGIADNGRELAAQLDELFGAWPLAIGQLDVLAHSMGGLVVRSAVHQARQQGMGWPRRLRAIAFLGTPHHGAPLERLGHGFERLLASNRFSAPFARLGALRSAGITDLRHGPWGDEASTPGTATAAQPAPLPAGVDCHVVAACLSAGPSSAAARLAGDGLVPLDSALGDHALPERALGIPDHRRHVAWRTGHLALLSRPEVGDRLVDWLA